MGKLTARKIQALRKPGRYSDGNGLILTVRAKGGKYWTVRYTLNGKRREAGLGGFPVVTLAEARAKALRAHQGQETIPTFAICAERYVKENSKWTAKTANSTMAQLEALVFPEYQDRPINEISRRDVLELIDRLADRPSAARKLRQRLRGVFQWAFEREYIDTNPAGEVVRKRIERLPTHANYRALPYAEIPAALDAIAAFQGVGITSKACLRFVILTAVRNGEARGARWSEIDGDVWVIPADRMKSSREHRVPLSRQALDVLAEMRPLADDSGYVFPSVAKHGRPLSDMTLTKILRSTGLAERTTVHGFRTAFRSWCQDNGATREVAEAALSHQLGDKTEQAYARSDMLARRRDLMAAWGDFATGNAAPALRLVV